MANGAGYVDCNHLGAISRKFIAIAHPIPRAPVTTATCWEAMTRDPVAQVRRFGQDWVR